MLTAASLVSSCAIVWLANVLMWRRRLGAPTRADRPPVLRLAVALALGVLVGEPLSVTAANTGTWGIFDGIGAAGAGGALVCGLVLVALMVALLTWSSENAAAWIGVTHRSPWYSCRVAAVVATIAFTPVFVIWWMLHDQEMIATVYLFTPDLARITQNAYWPGPGAGWLEAIYFPVEDLSLLPGVAVVLALPVVHFMVGVLRPDPSATPRWLPGPAGAGGFARPAAPVGTALLAGLVGGAVFIVSGWALALLFRHAVGGATVHRAADAGSVAYLAQSGIDLAALVAAAVAVVVAARTPIVGSVLGLFAASVSVLIAILTTPLLVTVGACGPGVYVCFRRAGFGDIYEAVYSYVSIEAPVKATVVACFAVGLAAVVRWLARWVRGPADPLGPRTAAPSRRLRLTAAITMAVVCLNLLASAYAIVWLTT
jgi:hypothetical protein